MRPTTAIRKRNIPQNRMPPNMSVATILIEFPYIATEFNINDKSFNFLFFKRKLNYLKKNQLI